MTNDPLILTHTSKPKETLREHRKASGYVDTNLRTFVRSIGAQFRQLREARGLTQEDVSKLVPIDRGYLSEIETGKRRVSLYIAYRLARSFDIKLNTLLELLPGDFHD